MATERIKESELQSLINRLNVKLNVKPETAYFLSMAYGGYRLEQNDGTGCRTISHDGYGTKRQLYTFLVGMLEGITANQE